MVSCPSCGDDFKSEQGMKVHHKRIHNKSISGIEAECDNCGDTFRDRKSEIERYEHNFCCRDCKDEFHSAHMTGRERPEHSRKMAELHSGKGNPMYGVRGEDAPNWQGGEQMLQGWRRSAEWYEARRSALERDDHSCQNSDCNTQEQLHVHHIEPVSEGGDKFDEDNLVTLCQEHHYDRHRNTY